MASYLATFGHISAISSPILLGEIEKLFFFLQFLGGGDPSLSTTTFGCRRTSSYAVAWLHLMKSMDFWLNSTPFFVAAAVCMMKIDNFRGQPSWTLLSLDISTLKLPIEAICHLSPEPYHTEFVSCPVDPFMSSQINIFKTFSLLIRVRHFHQLRQNIA